MRVAIVDMDFQRIIESTRQNVKRAQTDENGDGAATVLLGFAIPPRMGKLTQQDRGDTAAMPASGKGASPTRRRCNRYKTLNRASVLPL
jgi:hypothetical protein